MLDRYIVTISFPGDFTTHKIQFSAFLKSSKIIKINLFYTNPYNKLLLFRISEYSKPFPYLKCKYSVRKTISQCLIKRNPRKSSLDRLKLIFTRMKFMEIKNVVNVYETPASKIRKYLCLKRDE